MIRTRGARMAGCTVAVAALLAGCSAGATSSAPAIPAAATESAPVAWIDAVCGALLPLGPAMQAVPKFDRNDARATVQALSGYLGNVIGAFDQATGGLKAAGPSPVQGGDAAVSALTTSLAGSEAAVRRSKEALDKVNVDDPAALAAGLPTALDSLKELNTIPNPTAGLGSNPELNSAAAQAPNCRTFRSAGGGTGG